MLFFSTNSRERNRMKFLNLTYSHCQTRLDSSSQGIAVVQSGIEKEECTRQEVEGKRTATMWTGIHKRDLHDLSVMPKLVHARSKDNFKN